MITTKPFKVCGFSLNELFDNTHKYRILNMTFISHDQGVINPTESGHALLTSRTSSNFFVAPMGKGSNARLVEKVDEEEDGPMSGIGFSILGSIIGGALGLGPMFEVAFEAMKTGLELSEGRGSAVSFVPDIANL